MKMQALLGACRGCMLQVASHDRRAEPELTRMFEYCTNIKMPEEEKLPRHFCVDCSTTIDICFHFISKARKVDSTMRNYLLVVGDELNEESPLKYSNVSPKKEVEEEFSENYDRHELNIESDNRDIKDIQVDIYSTPDYYEDALENETLIVKGEPSEYKVKNDGKKQEKCMKKRESVHNNKRSRTECHLCKRIFSSKIWFEKHIKTAHSEHKIRTKTYVCKICSKGFSRSDILTQHMVTHSDERPFPCHLCPNKYKMRKQLNVHLRMHRDQILYKCDHCGASFKWKAVLLNHIRVHDEKKQHLCDLCGAGFTQLGNLVQHMRTHSGEKPFACPHCPFRCAMSSSLRRHQRIHDGTKPHTCHTCGKRFRDYSSLLRHIRTHTGELPYRCSFCSQAFIDSGKRKRHVLRHHPVAVTDFTSPLASRISHVTSDKLSN